MKRYVFSIIFLISLLLNFSLSAYADSENKINNKINKDTVKDTTKDTKKNVVEDAIKSHKEFVKMPDKLNASLLKSIYEGTPFFIHQDRDGIYSTREIIKEREELKALWLGASIRDKNSLANSLTLFFTPKELRKVGDIYLEDFNINFSLIGNEFFVHHSSLRPQKVPYLERNTINWLRTNKKQDIVLLVPKQRADFGSLGFMICTRAHNERKLKTEIELIDTKYEINKVKMEFSGNTRVSFTTGAKYKGKIDLNLIVSDVVAKPEITYDGSLSKDPNADLNYIPVEKEKVFHIRNDENIIGGLKFLYDMQYESGKRRISDFTNYVWVRRNNIDWPIKLKRYVNNKAIVANIDEGDCYNIILNVRTLNHTYLDENLAKN